ncbi:protein of unknown function [Maridesulfovibrio hydrothermalis AM13 = DSM 14728]|uniref:Uncharacterized protein n=1 Tax=Maridesulfovibrio hydrothermalis AM13 = DSM 14728 TaxID=1121451 RepID=L0RC89_9BACT|nr:protein of unknown function [Maridesulfovibrio hydrothermalis AM13 = DSM 14728]
MDSIQLNIAAYDKVNTNKNLKRKGGTVSVEPCRHKLI